MGPGMSLLGKARSPALAASRASELDVPLIARHSLDVVPPRGCRNRRGPPASGECRLCPGMRGSEPCGGLPSSDVGSRSTSRTRSANSRVGPICPCYLSKRSPCSIYQFLLRRLPTAHWANLQEIEADTASLRARSHGVLYPIQGGLDGSGYSQMVQCAEGLRLH